MAHVCNLGGAVVVLEIFRALRKSAVVVINVVYADTRGWAATKMTELGRALDRG